MKWKHRLQVMPRLIGVGSALLMVSYHASGALSDNDNAALEYWPVFFTMYTGDDLEEACSQAPESHLVDGKLPERVTDLLLDHSETVDRLIAATNMPTCDFGLQRDKGPHMLLSHLALTRSAARLLILVGLQAIEGNDAARAMECWASAYRLASHVSHDRVNISGLVAGSIVGYADTVLTDRILALPDRGNNAAKMLRSLQSLSADDPMGVVDCALGDLELSANWIAKGRDDEHARNEVIHYVSMVELEELIRELEGGDRSENLLERHLETLIGTPESFTGAVDHLYQVLSDLRRSAEAGSLDGLLGRLCDLMEDIEPREFYTDGRRILAAWTLQPLVRGCEEGHDRREQIRARIAQLEEIVQGDGPEW